MKVRTFAVILKIIVLAAAPLKTQAADLDLLQKQLHCCQEQFVMQPVNLNHGGCNQR